MDRRELLLMVSMLTTFFLPVIMGVLFALSGDWRRAAQEKARARRMAEHRMNARLLRLDI